MGIYELNTKGEKVYLELENICDGFLNWKDENGDNHYSKIYEGQKGCYIRYKNARIYSENFDVVDYFNFEF